MRKSQKSSHHGDKWIQEELVTNTLRENCDEQDYGHCLNEYKLLDIKGPTSYQNAPD